MNEPLVNPNIVPDSGQQGFCLRDLFAANALQGMLAGDQSKVPTDAKMLAMWAYQLADAMLKERVK